MTVTATIFIHGRQGTFDQFDHMAASGEEVVGAFAFDWSEGRLVEWGAAGFSEAARRSSAASVGVGAAVIEGGGPTPRSDRCLPSRLDAGGRP